MLNETFSDIFKQRASIKDTLLIEFHFLSTIKEMSLVLNLMIVSVLQSFTIFALF